MGIKIRLNKFLADRTSLSRRKADEMISRGRVKVNGKRAVLGFMVDVKDDKVELGSEVIANFTQEKLVYIMLNKPRKVVSTTQDENKRRTVVALVNEQIPHLPRIYPVGRLDAESEGMIILTNDGELAYRLTHPRYHIKKQYLVRVRGKLTDRALERMERGVPLKIGRTKPASVEVLQIDDQGAELLISISEGKNRQIRRMCQAVNVEVVSLKRVAMGSLLLGDLPPGKARMLNDSEVRLLSKRPDQEMDV
ncbi:MAG: pseudouridine synthase [Patescibacteria group bacterium]